jgi:hypothetical protein
MQLGAADKRWSSSLGIVHGANNSSLKKISLLLNVTNGHIGGKAGKKETSRKKRK